MSEPAYYLGRLSVEIGQWATGGNDGPNAAAAYSDISAAWFQLATEAARLAAKAGDDEAEARFYRMRGDSTRLPHDDVMHSLRGLLGLGSDDTLCDVVYAVGRLIDERDRLRSNGGER